MHTVNVSFQLIPINTEQAYPCIDAAIEVIQTAGVRYQVTPFATIMEGEISVLLDLVQKAKDAALAAGAPELVINLQVHLKRDEDVHFEEKTEKWT